MKVAFDLQDLKFRKQDMGTLHISFATQHARTRHRELGIKYQSGSMIHGKSRAHVLHGLPIATTFRKFPKGSTSAIRLAPANSITILSTPQPHPPVGGIPHSSASM